MNKRQAKKKIKEELKFYADAEKAFDKILNDFKDFSEKLFDKNNKWDNKCWYIEVDFEVIESKIIKE